MTETPQKIDDVGPAFPPLTSTEAPYGGHSFMNTTGGMSTRMWLAGMAMQGVISDVSSYQTEKDMITKVVKISFIYADAMIAAAQKEQSA